MTNTSDWERQLASIAESDHTDSATMADLGISYAAATGDESLIECFTVFEQVFVNRSWPVSSGSFSQRGRKGCSWSDVLDPRPARNRAFSFSRAHYSDYAVSLSLTFGGAKARSNSRSQLHAQSWSDSYHYPNRKEV